jgi:hypothetical protein
LLQLLLTLWPHGSLLWLPLSLLLQQLLTL